MANDDALLLHAPLLLVHYAARCQPVSFPVKRDIQEVTPENCCCCARAMRWLSMLQIVWPLGLRWLNTLRIVWPFGSRWLSTLRIIWPTVRKKENFVRTNDMYMIRVYIDNDKTHSFPWLQHRIVFHVVTVPSRSCKPVSPKIATRLTTGQQLDRTILNRRRCCTRVPKYSLLNSINWQRDSDSIERS